MESYTLMLLETSLLLLHRFFDQLQGVNQAID